MFEYIFGILIGFYSGGAYVTSVVTATIDGEPAKWTDKFVLAFMWPLALYEASQNAEDEENK